MAGFSLLRFFIDAFRAFSLRTSYVAGSGLGAGDEAVRWNIEAVLALVERTTWPSILNLPWLPLAPAKVHTPYLSMSAHPYRGPAALLAGSLRALMALLPPLYCSPLWGPLFPTLTHGRACTGVCMNTRGRPSASWPFQAWSYSSCPSCSCELPQSVIRWALRLSTNLRVNFLCQDHTPTPWLVGMLLSLFHQKAPRLREV